jgi:hypothetical protein
LVDTIQNFPSLVKLINSYGIDALRLRIRLGNDKEYINYITSISTEDGSNSHWNAQNLDIKFYATDGFHFKLLKEFQNSIERSNESHSKMDRLVIDLVFIDEKRKVMTWFNTWVTSININRELNNW